MSRSPSSSPVPESYGTGLSHELGANGGPATRLSSRSATHRRSASQVILNARVMIETCV